jgi:hypothetical protein
MGANLSNQYTQNVLNDFNSVVNSTVTNVIQNVSTTCTDVNSFQGIFGSYPTQFVNGQVTATAICPTNIKQLTISQNASNTCTLSGTSINSVQETLNTTLSNNIQTWIGQQTTQNNGWVPLFVINASNAGISNTTTLSNKIANDITANISQTCSAILGASNQGIVSVCGNYPDGVLVVQNALSTNLTTCLINNTVTAITNDSVLNAVVTKTSQQTAQTNEGLSTIAKYIIIAVVAVVVLIIIGVILYFVFGGSKAPAPMNEMNAKEREKRMLEREVIEKREKMEGKPTNAVASFTTRGNADESAKELFERHDKLTSPTYLDRFKSLASKYGGMAAEAEA